MHEHGGGENFDGQMLQQQGIAPYQSAPQNAQYHAQHMHYDQGHQNESSTPITSNNDSNDTISRSAGESSPANVPRESTPSGQIHHQQMHYDSQIHPNNALIQVGNDLDGRTSANPSPSQQNAQNQQNQQNPQNSQNQQNYQNQQQVQQHHQHQQNPQQQNLQAHYNHPNQIYYHQELFHEDPYIDDMIRGHAIRMFDEYRLADLGRFAAHLDFQIVPWLKKCPPQSAQFVDDPIIALHRLHQDFEWPYPSPLRDGNASGIVTAGPPRANADQSNYQQTFNKQMMQNGQNGQSCQNGHSGQHGQNGGNYGQIHHNVHQNQMNHNHMSNHNYYKNPLEELSIVSLQEAHLSSMHSLPDGSSTIGFSESISDFDTSSATVGVADPGEAYAEAPDASGNAAAIGAPRMQMQLRYRAFFVAFSQTTLYLLELFLEAECLDWAMMICLVLRDSETIARLINRFTDTNFVSERQMKRLAAIVLAIDKWSEQECMGYRSFFYRIRSENQQLEEALRLPGIPNLYSHTNVPKTGEKVVRDNGRDVHRDDNRDPRDYNRDPNRDSELNDYHGLSSVNYSEFNSNRDYTPNFTPNSPNSGQNLDFNQYLQHTEPGMYKNHYKTASPENSPNNPANSTKTRTAAKNSNNRSSVSPPVQSNNKQASQSRPSKSSRSMKHSNSGGQLNKRSQSMLVGKMNGMTMDSRVANSMTTSQISSNNTSQNLSSGGNQQNFGSRDFNSQNFQNPSFQHQSQNFQQNTTQNTQQTNNQQIHSQNSHCSQQNYQQSPQNNKNQSFSPQSHNAPGGQFQTHLNLSSPHQISHQNSNLTSNNSSDKINELDKTSSSVGNDALVLSSLSSPLSKLNRVPPMTKAVSYGSFPYSSNASASEKLRQRQSPTNNGMAQPAVDESAGGSGSVNNNYSLPKSHSIEDLNEGGNAEGQEAGCSLM